MRRAFYLEDEAIAFDCLQWQEELISRGWSTTAVTGGRPLATYLQTGRTGLAETRLGAGHVLSFGFQYGYAYSCRMMPIVPPQSGKREMHPVVLLKETLVAALVGTSPLALLPPRKGVESARFGSRLIIINHRASPLELGILSVRNAISQIPSVPRWLGAHAAILLET